MSQKSLKDALRKAVARITATKSWPAIIIGEGSHPTRSLVQLSNGVEMEVLNTATMALAGQHVRIGYSPTNPGEMQVLGIIGSASILNRLYLYNYTIGSHHKNHEAPNPDMVYVYGMAFLPDGVMPYRGLSVIVHGEVAWDGSDWKTPARRVVNLSTHVPGAGCRYVLLEADGEDVIVTDGSIVASTSLLTLDKLPRPTAGRKPLAGVALQAGQTDIMQDVRVGKRNDILDLRWNRYANGGLADLAKDLDIANLPVEASPTSGDKLVIDRAGVRSQIDWDDLPAGGGGANWSDIDSATADTPLDADKFGFWDVVDAALKSITWANIKAALKTYFDTLYAVAAKGVTNGDSHDHNGGDGAAIVEAAITLADNTTNDVSITKHGFTPKAPNDTAKFLRGDASWAAVPGLITMVTLFNAYDTDGKGWGSAGRSAGTYTFDLQDANNNLPSGITGVLIFVQAKWATVTDGSTQLKIRPRGGSTSINLVLQGQANNIRNTGFFVCPVDATYEDIEIEVVGATSVTNLKIAGYIK